MKKMKNKQAKKASKLAKAENMKQHIITVKNAEGDPDTKAEILIQNKINYTPKVSVIIPVYNVEEYLRECLDSVVNQTLKEIEIICVDDGSTDNSLEILKEYAKKDNRITVISQKNINAGVARNAGLAVAMGEFIGFIDSDDYISLEMYEKLYNKSKQEKLDICICRFLIKDEKKSKDIKDNGINLWCIKYFNQDKGGNIINQIQKPIFQMTNPAPWNKIYNRQFLKDNKNLFQSVISTNDVAFTNMALCLSKSIGLIYENLYFYRINTNKSLTDTKDKNILCYYEAIKELKKRLEAKNLYNAYYQSFINACVGYCIYNYNKVSNRNKSLLKKYTKENIFKLIELSQNKLNLLYNETYKKICKMFIELNDFPKVSIVLPIYNAEPYLRECLDSVVNQTLKDIEIICVNDGSTDNSLEIIKEYAKKDIRIRYIDKPNAGYGQTMNCGMDLATGEYIGIVEPDDFIKPEMYETLYNKAKEFDLDIIKANYYKFEKIGADYNYKREKLINDSKYYNTIMTPASHTRLLTTMTINPAGIFKKSFLNQYNIRHNETPGAAYQDNGFWVQTIYQADKILFLDNPFYCYRQDNPNQSMKKKNNLWTIPDEYAFIDKIFEKNKKLQKFKSIYIYRKFIAYIFHLTARISVSYWPEYLKRMQKEFKNTDLKYFSEQEKQQLELILQGKFSEYIKKYAQQVKVSVIIPVYNTEKYLRECLDSVINQTLKDIEIICIDDGSMDNSLQILQEYAKKDDRIIVLTQENQKQGAARNKGLSIARGEYIQFVDSDDYLVKDACERIYNKGIEANLDMILIEGKVFNDKSRKNIETNNYTFSYIPKQFETTFNYRKCKHFITKFSTATWCTAYNRKFIKEINLTFPEKVYFEDNVFFIKALFKAKKISILKNYIYMHRMHNNQTTQNWDKHLADYLKITDMVLSYLKKEKVSADIFNEYQKTYFGTIAWVYNSKCNAYYKKKYYKSIKELMKKYKADNSFSIPLYHNKIFAYTMLPLNLLKIAFLKTRQMDINRTFICRQLKSMRIDIKNFGKAENGTDIATAAKVLRPAWFANEQGQGCVAESCGNTEKLAITCRGTGKLRLDFRAADKRCNGTRFPLWIDYKSIKINGKEQLTAPVATWHDKPYRFEMPVKDGQVVTVEVVQQYHQYTKDELQDVILKLNPNSDYIKENIEKLTNKIYDKITVKPAAPRAKKPKAASNQELLASIAALNARIERLEQENRERQAQLLAAINTLKKS